MLTGAFPVRNGLNLTRAPRTLAHWERDALAQPGLGEGAGTGEAVE